MHEYLSTDRFRNASIGRLAGSVRIPTESFDDMGPIGEDRRWDIMYAFADYLELTFPRVHKELRVEKVNTHGLIYTWPGSDPALKPTLLMAHQDVVPVPSSTVAAWTHPPFSGFYDGTHVWGRGASDCKNQLIAALETLELLLDAGFAPRRTVIVSLGFDEEISGSQGAGHLAPFLLTRYGRDGIAALVDEGATFERAWGRTFAKPGVAEKGYTDVDVVVRMPGGHSSIPSDHTSIGVAGRIVAAMEEYQYPLELSDDNPYLAQLYCGAEHASDFPSNLKHLLSAREKAQSRGESHNDSSETRNTHSQHDRKAHPDSHDPLAHEAAKAGPAVRYLMQTSQAADVIAGGVKVNALPERTVVTINHRVNLGSHPAAVHAHLASLVAPIAHNLSLAVHAFDGVDEAPQSISLSASKATLDVAPVSPTRIDGDGDVSTPYAVLAGTVRALYGPDVLVAPGIMTGNTDTRYYWDLTRHIFRFGPGYDPSAESGLGNIHTVNERVSVVSHVNAVKWFALFVRNMDAAEL